MPPPPKLTAKTRAMLAPGATALASRGGLSPNDIIEAKRLFCAEFSKRGNIADACRAAAVSRQQFYVWRDLDPIFLQAFEIAKETAFDAMEREVHRRAFEGTDIPAINKDGVVIHPFTGKQVFIKQYSDFLADKMMRANRPDKFGNKLEVSRTDVGRTQDSDIIAQLSKLGVTLRTGAVTIEGEAVRPLAEVPEAVAPAGTDLIEQNIYLMGAEWFEKPPEPPQHDDSDVVDTRGGPRGLAPPPGAPSPPSEPKAAPRGRGRPAKRLRIPPPPPASDYAGRPPPPPPPPFKEATS